MHTETMRWTIAVPTDGHIFVVVSIDFCWPSEEKQCALECEIVQLILAQGRKKTLNILGINVRWKCVWFFSVCMWTKCTNTSALPNLRLKRTHANHKSVTNMNDNDDMDWRQTVLPMQFVVNKQFSGIFSSFALKKLEKQLWMSVGCAQFSFWYWITSQNPAEKKTIHSNLLQIVTKQFSKFSANRIEQNALKRRRTQNETCANLPRSGTKNYTDSLEH